MAAPLTSQSAAQAVLRGFLLSILPPGTEVIAGQDNRVVEPSASNFVVMTPTTRQRLETNVSVSADVAFTASITGTQMTVSAVRFGSILPGAQVWGVNNDVADATRVVSGPGGVGVYVVSTAQTVLSERMAAGVRMITQSVQQSYQLDVHSAVPATAADMAETISTLFRDEVASSFFDASGVAVFPLYADDPRQMPFINAEQQYEARWVIEACIQFNQQIAWPQQFADAASVTLIPPI